jgi:hypothetical protein
MCTVVKRVDMPGARLVVVVVVVVVVLVLS